MATAVASVAAQSAKTYADYIETSEAHPDMRVELVDGELIMSPAPRPLHQIVSYRLSQLLGKYVDENQLGQLLYAPVGVRLAQDVLVQPDLLFIRQERVADLIGDDNVNGAPDLVVEILSPSTAHYDRHAKLLTYARHGVPEYWIVDTDNQVVEVYMLENGRYLVAAILFPTEKINVGCFADAAFPVHTIFTDAS